MEGPIEIESLRTVVKERLLPYDRRLESVIDDSSGMKWRKVEVDLNIHVQEHVVEDPDDDAVADFISALYTKVLTLFDKTKYILANG